MPTLGTNKTDFFAELEQLGEDEVRVRLATRVYSDVNTRGALAREWLQRRDLARAAEASRESREFNSEHLRTAKSAKNAAWAAAVAAIIAAISAIVAIVMSFQPN